MIKTILKVCLAIVVCLLVNPGLNSGAFAESKSDTLTKANIVEVLKNLEAASNKHNVESVAIYYDNSYLSGDNLSKKQLLDILKETWQAYPDIDYTSTVKDIRFSDNWASVETYDNCTATTAKPSEITNDKGNLNSESHSTIYLRKVGKDWKIVGDYTYYENAIVKYGSTKDLDIKFSAPEQVKAGQMYSAKIFMEVPVGFFAVGSITQEPIIYPTIKLKEKFRTINQSVGNLERVFESNVTNNNELVTATVGITELTEDNQARPVVQLKGICVIANRVNVIASSNFDKKEYEITNKENLELEPGQNDSSSSDDDVNGINE